MGKQIQVHQSNENASTNNKKKNMGYSNSTKFVTL